MLKVSAWNIYSSIRANARIVAATDHEVPTVRAALDKAESLAVAWNAKETRSDMLVTMLSCGGYVRPVPQQGSLF